VPAAGQRVYLIDASIYIFRAWFSVPGSLTNRAGEPINAVHGFAGFLAGFLSGVRPEYTAVVFDESLTTSFRNDIYPAYKANREPAPPELKRQFGMCRRLVEALGLSAYSSHRYEADDLIGTLAGCLRPAGFSIEILSADKDLAQLVGDGDVLWDFARNRRHASSDIPQLLGVHPGQVADWLALTGDAVDNIPGVPGIGARTAAALLAEFGSLDGLYADLDAVAESGLRGAARIRRLLEEHEDTARLARELTGIVVDPDLGVQAGDVKRRPAVPAEVEAVCGDIGLGRTTQARLLKAVAMEKRRSDFSRDEDLK
jgi:5'-3' exonuclease